MDNDLELTWGSVFHPNSACPMCGSWNIDSQGSDFDCATATQECYCEDCHSTWRDVYNFSHVTLFHRGKVKEETE